MAQYIAMALLFAAAGYAVVYRDKPRPSVSDVGKIALWVCAGVIAVCLILLVALVTLVPHPSG